MTGKHPASPPAVSLPWIATAVVVWILAVVFLHLTAPDPMEPGPLSGRATLMSDPVASRFGHRVMADTRHGPLLLEVDEVEIGLLRGSEVVFEGEVTSEPGIFGAHRYRARVSVRALRASGGSTSPHVRLGDSIRRRVLLSLEPMDAGRALLAGFLIGDTSGLARSDEEAMRLAGLSHFVAVSGSNVALFLGLLFFAAGPFAVGPKRRALLGLLGLPVYAAATRFEPSVMRASVMAGLALGGRLLGVAFEAWQLLSLAVMVLVVLQPSLTASAGFQLSVAATAGVLVGARWPVRGGVVGRALAVTIGAQVAVAPLIIAHFGAVPMMSPLVNLVAAPIVAASTLTGALGVGGLSILVDIAAWLASLVLFLARGAETWPQLGVMTIASLVAAAVVSLGVPRVRPALTLAGLAVTTLAILGVGRGAPAESVIVLDVGQGDALLVHGGGGRYALIDGGPDESRLLERLRAYGVDRLELVVLTHVHADHATGLAAIPGRLPVGHVWTRAEPHETQASTVFFEKAAAAGLTLSEPAVGDSWQLGGLELVVRGPARRYASPNDQSMVIDVIGPRRTMLLAGDIEVVAQSELGDSRADVLKVPHQGAATSDPDWLRRVGADVAVISVGPNQFGHPADWVIETLEDSGAEVFRTDRDGDVVMRLGEAAS